MDVIDAIGNTPLIELKRVEEPELTRRFGERYSEYKKRVPMFIPRLGRSREPSNPTNRTKKR